MHSTHQFIYTVRVVYKSGYQHDFRVYYFKQTAVGYEWEYVDDDNNPILLGMDNVESIWVVKKEVNHV